MGSLTAAESGRTSQRTPVPPAASRVASAAPGQPAEAGAASSRPGAATRRSDSSLAAVGAATRGRASRGDAVAAAELWRSPPFYFMWAAPLSALGQARGSRPYDAPTGGGWGRQEGALMGDLSVERDPAPRPAAEREPRAGPAPPDLGAVAAPPAWPSAARGGGPAEAGHLLRLQRLCGNRRVARLVGEGRGEASAVASFTPPVQRDDAADRRNAAYDDASRGLTRAQHHQLGLALRWTANLMGFAAEPPRWDLMHAQSGQLERDVLSVLNRKDLTQLARLTLEPAMAQSVELNALIAGAKEPLEQVFLLVEGRLKNADASIGSLLKPVSVGGVTISSRAEFDRLLDEARKAPDKRIPGTAIVVADEAGVRRQYEPLSELGKASLQEFKAILARLATEASGKQPPLKLIHADLANLAPSVERFAADHQLSAYYRAEWEVVRLEVSRALLLITGKLAPVANTLSQVRLRTGEIPGDDQPDVRPAAAPRPERAGRRRPADRARSPAGHLHLSAASLRLLGDLGAQALLLLPQLRGEGRAEVVCLEDRADLELALRAGGIGAALGPRDRLVHRLHLPQPEAAD